MWMTIAIGIYLMILGIKDWIDRKISICWLCAGGVLTTGMGIYRCIGGGLVWWELLVGMLPGLLLLMAARLSGKAGYADGIVMVQMGACMGYRECLLLFCCSMLLTAVISMLLLILRKVRRDTPMPYLTFLAIVFSVLRILGCIVLTS